MKRKLAIVLILFVWLSTIYLPAFADHPEKKDFIERTSLVLSKKLQRILSAEMNSVQHGMTNLAIAIPAGNWNSVAETAGSIRDGYILDKQLSEKEMKEFQNSLPAGYALIDREFKQMAKDMIDAAIKADADEVNRLYYRLNGTCIDCHVKYAKDRFPGFQ